MAGISAATATGTGWECNSSGSHHPPSTTSPATNHERLISGTLSAATMLQHWKQLPATDSPMLGEASADSALKLLPPPLDSRLSLMGALPIVAATPCSDVHLRLLPLLALGMAGTPSLLLLWASDWLALVSAGMANSGCWLHCHWWCSAEHASSTLRQRLHSTRSASPGGVDSVSLGMQAWRPPADCCCCCAAGAFCAGSARLPQPLAGA